AGQIAALYMAIVPLYLLGFQAFTERVGSVDISAFCNLSLIGGAYRLLFGFLGFWVWTLIPAVQLLLCWKIVVALATSMEFLLPGEYGAALPLLPGLVLAFALKAILPSALRERLTLIVFGVWASIATLFGVGLAWTEVGKFISFPELHVTESGPNLTMRPS